MSLSKLLTDIKTRRIKSKLPKENTLAFKVSFKACSRNSSPPTKSVNKGIQIENSENLKLKKK
jgi:hypothetical protein